MSDRAAASRRAGRARTGSAPARNTARSRRDRATTLTTFGFGQLGGVVDAAVERRHLQRRIVANGATGFGRSARGSISGSSPCTLTTMSQSSVAATSARRSVPVG